MAEVRSPAPVCPVRGTTYGDEFAMAAVARSAATSPEADRLAKRRWLSGTLPTMVVFDVRPSNPKSGEGLLGAAVRWEDGVDDAFD